MIVAVSHPGDEHALAVLDAIERARHPVALVNTADFPVASSIALRVGAVPTVTIRAGDRLLDMEQAGAIWWRRPQPYTLDPEIDATSASFAYTECHEAISGMWHGLRAAWVNPPDQDEVAHHKPYQLAVAAELGLSVPETLVTNDPEAARDFLAERDPLPTVYKTFIATESHWRETRILRPDERALLDRVRLAPVIFQEFVPAVADLRVTMVGGTVIATAIATDDSTYALDYRVDLGAARFRPTELPPDVEALLLALLNRLGLVYGAVDMRLTPEGEYVFLEVNPAGEWLFVEQRSGQQITAAMADLLVTLDRERQ